MKVAAALCLLALLGCGGSSTAVPSTPLPVRAHTAGQELLAKAPLGADLILEIDLARLRDNAALGPLLTGLAAPKSLGSIDLLQGAEAALICVYDIGDDPRQLIVLQMDAQPEEFGQEQTIRSLGNGYWGIGDSALLRQAEALTDSSGSMLMDSAARRMREQVMPSAADNAAFRLVARLDFDARVALASKVGVSEVPVSIAVWADVVDDLAIVMDLATEEEGADARLAGAMEALRSRLARQAYVRYLGLSDAVRKIRILRTPKGMRAVFVLPPKSLARFVQRVERQLRPDTTIAPDTTVPDATVPNETTSEEE